MNLAVSSIIEDDAKIGDNTSFGYFCYVGHGVKIGDNCNFGHRVTIADNTVIGNNVYVGNGVIFSDTKTPREKLLARNKNESTIVEDEAIIGAGCIVTRCTVIKKGAHIGDGSKVVGYVPGNSFTISPKSFVLYSLSSIHV